MSSIWKDSRILPITYQSGELKFSDWVSVFTLCLAPLIAHIIAGAPQPSFLCKTRPKWHDRICNYNPTSILWRYAAITDRRIRALAWSPGDMAASNALFWTPKGWDGSEDMVVRSMKYCARLPEKSRVAIFSRDMIKTIIITIQGIQAVSVIASVLGGSDVLGDFIYSMGVDLVFFPIAFIGLLRLSSGFWLTEDFDYTAINEPEMTRVVGAVEEPGRASLDSLLDLGDNCRLLSERFRPVSWRSRLFYIVYLIPIAGLLTVCLLLMLPGAGLAGARVFTTTSFLVAAFYLILLLVTLVICGYYFAKGRTTTVIPCIASKWYKAHTLVLMGLGLVLIIIAAIETRKSPCGNYTSMPGLEGDAQACMGENINAVIYVNPTYQTIPGFETICPNQGQNKTMPIGLYQMWIYNLTGVCLGNIDASLI